MQTLLLIINNEIKNNIAPIVKKQITFTYQNCKLLISHLYINILIEIYVNLNQRLLSDIDFNNKQLVLNMLYNLYETYLFKLLIFNDTDNQVEIQHLNNMNFPKQINNIINNIIITTF
jgi:hypothetical protein